MDTSRGTYHSEGRYRALTLLVRKSSQRSIFASQKDPHSGRQFSVGKGRSCNHSMLRVTQKLGALALNVSDGPSGGSVAPGYQFPSSNKEIKAYPKRARSWDKRHQINPEITSTSQGSRSNESIGTKHKEAGGRQEEDEDKPESSGGSITLVGNILKTEGGKSSKERRDDSPRVQQHQLRAAGLICSLAMSST